MTPRRSLLVLASFAALVLVSALSLVGCRDRRADFAPGRTPRDPSATPDVPLLEGRSGDVVAWVTPLGLGEAPAQWYRERLTALVPESAGRSFARLYVFHVGADDAAPLVLADPSVEVETAEGLHADVPILEDETTPPARASVVTAKALRSFTGRSLPPGRMLEALVAFEGRFEVDELLAGRVRLSPGTEVALERTAVSLGELRRLLESPGREALVAREANLPPDDGAWELDEGPLDTEELPEPGGPLDDAEPTGGGGR